MSDGMASRAIAREVGVMTGIVSIWRKRFAAAGIDGLKDKPRPGAKPVYTDATDKRILAMLDQPVPKGRARWDGKLLASELGDIRSTVLGQARSSASRKPTRCPRSHPIEITLGPAVVRVRGTVNPRGVERCAQGAGGVVIAPSGKVQVLVETPKAPPLCCIVLALPWPRAGDAPPWSLIKQRGGRLLVALADPGGRRWKAHQLPHLLSRQLSRLNERVSESLDGLAALEDQRARHRSRGEQGPTGIGISGLQDVGSLGV